MFVVDTNVLVYAADGESSYHKACRELLEGCRSGPGPWYLTWGITYEFLRVVTHPRVFRRPWSAGQAWNFVEALLASPGLDVLGATKRHEAVLAEVLHLMPFLSGNLLHDTETAVLMKEHGVRTIYTRDADFHRFKFLETVDPVQI